MQSGELLSRMDRAVKCGCRQCEEDYMRCDRELRLRAFHVAYRDMERYIMPNYGRSPAMDFISQERERIQKDVAEIMQVPARYITKEAKVEPKEVNWDPAIKVLLDKRTSAESTHKAYAETVKTYRASLKSSVANEKKAARELASYQRALKKLGYKD